MGIGAALGTAAAWAVASTFLASQTARVDTLTLIFIQAIWSGAFFVAALFALGGLDDLAAMSFHNMWQLSMAGFLGTGITVTLTAAAIALLGLVRPFAIITGLIVLLTFIFAAILLGDAVTWQDGLGSALVLTGVYLVALYGRPRSGAAGAAPEPRSARPASIVPPALSITAARRHGPARRRPRWRIAGGGADSMESATAAPAYDQGRPRDVLPTLFLGSSRAVGRSAAATLPVFVRWAYAHRLAIGIALAVAASASGAASTVWLRAAAVDVNPSAAAIVRVPLILGVLGVGAWLWPNSHLRAGNVDRRTMSAMALYGILGTGVSSLLIIVAIQEIGAGQAIAVFSVSPLIGLPLAMIFLREQITRWAVVGTVIAVAGIAALA